MNAIIGIWNYRRAIGEVTILVIVIIAFATR
jgi:hypothetical protein